MSDETPITNAWSRVTLTIQVRDKHSGAVLWKQVEELRVNDGDSIEFDFPVDKTLHGLVLDVQLQDV